MFDHLLTEEQRRVRDDARDLVCEAAAQGRHVCYRVPHGAAGRLGFFRRHRDGERQRRPLPAQRPEALHRTDIRLASTWTGTNEVMAMIVADEWYREAAADAPEAEAAGELIYE